MISCPRTWPRFLGGNAGFLEATVTVKLLERLGR